MSIKQYERFVTMKNVDGNFNTKRFMVLNFKNEKDKEAKTIDNMHHIHIIDRSYSLSNEIKSLIEDVKKSIKSIPDGDFISVVWFSSEKEFGTVLKCVKKSANDYEYINKMLDSINYCIGCTCFSDPIKEVHKIVEESKVICEYFNITLFTDGCSCTGMPSNLDETLSIDEVKAMSDKIMSFNTIGFGHYYDENFLKALSNESIFGKFIHSSEITDYSEIFNHNYLRVKDKIADSINIRNIPEGTQVLYLSDKDTKFYNGVSEIKLNMISKKKNQFIFLFDEKIHDKLDVTYMEFSTSNNEIENIRCSDSYAKTIPSSTLNNALYGFAYEYYYANMRDESLEFLSYLGDKRLIDEHINSFSIEEVAKHTKNLKTVIFKNIKREKGTVSKDYLPSSTVYCIMDLLSDFARTNVKYVPQFNEYKRIGLKTEIVDNKFIPSEENIVVPFSDLVFNKSKLNLSLRFLRGGKVRLGKDVVENYFLPEVMSTSIFQTHTIIKDGNLNMSKIKIALSKNDYDYFINEIPNFKLMITPLNEVIEYNNMLYNCFLIDLTKLPIINRSYSKLANNIEYVYDKVYKGIKLENQQKILNALIKITKEKLNDEGNVLNEGKFASYSEEQIKVLEGYGLNKDLIYVGTERKVAEKKEEDYYEARTLEFSLAGFSSIPSVSAILAPDFGTKKLIPSLKLMKEEYDSILKEITLNKTTEERLIILNSLLDGVKKDLIANRISLNLVKISKVLTGSWWKELKLNNKGDKYEWNPNNKEEENLPTLYVKTNYEKVYF